MAKKKSIRRIQTKENIVPLKSDEDNAKTHSDGASLSENDTFNDANNHEVGDEEDKMETVRQKRCTHFKKGNINVRKLQQFIPPKITKEGPNCMLKPGQPLPPDAPNVLLPDEKPSTLWVCLKCGEINCGRNDASHAVLHNESTTHEISMDVETNQIWLAVKRLFRTP
ncbi:hypothetical protein HK096_009674 [Nowakowskiella sp. JEL0078]|nr:hypothetical protein HK096_009674 [Nowakowskiella sp. JEL0078]